MVYTSLKELEERLPARQFIRVHKSFIIAIDKITGIEGNMVKLKGIRETIPASDGYKAALMGLIRGKMIE